MKTKQFSKILFRIFPVFLLFQTIFSLEIIAQTNSETKQSLGMQLFTYRYFSESHTPSKYGICIPLGFLYKKNLGGLAFRYGLTYNRSRYKLDWDGPDSFYGFRYHSIIKSNLGLQKNFFYHRLNYYFGLDFYPGLSIYKADLDGGFANQGFFYTNKLMLLGLAPFCGLGFEISSRFSIAFETSYNFTHVIPNKKSENDPFYKDNENFLNPINSITLFYSF